MPADAARGEQQQPSPAAVTADPAVMNPRKPIRSASRPATGAKSRIMPLIGSSRSPAWAGEYPAHVLQYRVRKKMVPHGP